MLGVAGVALGGYLIADPFSSLGVLAAVTGVVLILTGAAEIALGSDLGRRDLARAAGVAWSAAPAAEGALGRDRPASRARPRGHGGEHRPARLDPAAARAVLRCAVAASPRPARDDHPRGADPGLLPRRPDVPRALQVHGLQR